MIVFIRCCFVRFPWILRRNRESYIPCKEWQRRYWEACVCDPGFDRSSKRAERMVFLIVMVNDSGSSNGNGRGSKNNSSSISKKY